MTRQTNASEQVPSPGSREASDLGCVCPVLDNHFGDGVPWPRDDGLDPKEHPSFWVSGNCPLHGKGDVT